MDDILAIFRGDPDDFEVTRPMKFLLSFFGVMLVIVPISLYVMLHDVSDQTFAAFTCILVADLVLMVVADILIVLIWIPTSPTGQTRVNPCSTNQCLPTQQTTDSVCSAPSDAFRYISVGELSHRLEDLLDKDEQGSEEGRKNSPRDKPVCTVEVHKSSKSPNLDPNRDFSKHTSEQGFGCVRCRQVSYNPQSRCVEDGGYASIRACEPSRKSSNQNEAFHRNFSVPGPSPKRFWYQKNLTAVPHRSTGDSKERTVFECVGDEAQSRGPICVNLDQSGASHGHVSIPVPSQDGFNGCMKGQKTTNSLSSQQCMTELKGQKSRCDCGANPSNPEQTDVDQKGQKTPNPPSSQQCMTELKKEQNSDGRCACGVDPSNPESTDVDQDKTGASSSQQTPKEDGLRHHKRFWTDPQPPRDSAKREELNQSSESLDEVIKNMERQKELNRSLEVQPTVRGFTKRRKRYNYYMETTSFRRRRFAASSVSPSNIDDALELVPLIREQSKQSSTAAWVFDDKNVIPCDSEAPPPFKRSKSAPSKPRRGLVSPPMSPSNNRFPIPACGGDTRHRVLHRLLATILTSGSDSDLGCPSELENSFEEGEVPKMEAEALPSGDYVMHIQMRLTSTELQNFKSRRATIVKDSEFKKYLSTLC